MILIRFLDKKMYKTEKLQNDFLKSCITKKEGVTAAEAIAKGTEKIKQLTSSYQEWLRTQINCLITTYEGFDPAEQENAFNILYHQAHDIKSLGSTFSYPLVTEVSYSLCCLLEFMMENKAWLSEPVYIHIRALELIIAKDVKGEGGENGKKILEGLDQIVKNALQHFEKSKKN
jgi:hypothetical protein